MPVQMVEPEREMPGMVATSWAAPTASALLPVMFSAVRRPRSCREAVRSSSPVSRKQNPSTVTSLSVEKPSTKSLMKNISSRGANESSKNSSIRRMGGMWRLWGRNSRPVKRSPTR